jgi:hypothetical protein
MAEEMKGRVVGGEGKTAEVVAGMKDQHQESAAAKDRAH